MELSEYEKKIRHDQINGILARLKAKLDAQDADAAPEPDQVSEDEKPVSEQQGPSAEHAERVRKATEDYLRGRE